MSVDVETLLSEHDEKIARIARALRAVVGTAAPDAEESVQVGWGTIGYRIERLFLLISPRRDHVRLMFEAGKLLPDPDDILVPTGKKMVHIAYDDPDAIDWLQVTRYVQNAAELDRWGEIERVA